MNYESYIQGNFETQLNKAQTLLNKSEELLQSENLKKALKPSFDTLKEDLKQNLQRENSRALNQNKAELREFNNANLQNVFSQNKEEIINSLSEKIDIESLFLKHKNEFLKSNTINEELKKLLNENEDLNHILNTLEAEVSKAKESLEEKASQKLEALNLNSLITAIIEDKIQALSYEALENNKALIAKESVKSLMQDESFLNSLSTDVVNEGIFVSEVKRQLERILNALNEKAISRLMDENKLKKRLVEQDILLLNLSLQNELKILNENLSLVNDLSLMQKRREFLEQIDEENANTLLENKFKVI